MECLGGNGYVEEGILARHYRESPVNAIWEGSGNVMCLDVLRALSREAEAAIGGAAGIDARRRRACRARARRQPFIGKTFRRPDSERVARLAVEKLALLAAAAALNMVAPRQCGTVRARRGSPIRTPACTAQSISPRRRCARPAGAGAALKVCSMESATATKCQQFASSDISPPAAVTPAERPPRVWKFWGTALWGLFVFAAMFVGQIAVVIALLRASR